MNLKNMHISVAVLEIEDWIFESLATAGKPVKPVAIATSDMSDTAVANDGDDTSDLLIDLVKTVLLRHEAASMKDARFRRVNEVLLCCDGGQVAFFHCYYYHCF